MCRISAGTAETSGRTARTCGAMSEGFAATNSEATGETSRGTCGISAGMLETSGRTAGTSGGTTVGLTATSATETATGDGVRLRRAPSQEQLVRARYD